MPYGNCTLLEVNILNLESQSLADISKWLLRKLNTVSTLINKMEKERLVKKATNREDGKVYIKLTPKGSELWEQVSERAISLTFAALSQEEKEQFRELLKKLRAEVRNILGLDFKPPFLP